MAINTRLNRDDVGYILEHSGARTVFVDHELAHLVEGSGLATIRIEDTGTADDPYEQFLAGGSPERFEVPVADEEQTISINYTSGTTGRPKGVMYSHRGAYLNAFGWRHSNLTCALTRYSCGRCRCSTATGGASRGR